MSDILKINGAYHLTLEAASIELDLALSTLRRRVEDAGLLPIRRSGRAWYPSDVLRQLVAHPPARPRHRH